MMSIIERLRNGKGNDPESHWLMIEAADEIKRLREALQHMLRWHDQLSPADIAKAEAALKIGQKIGQKTKMQSNHSKLW